MISNSRLKSGDSNNVIRQPRARPWPPTDRRRPRHEQARRPVPTQPVRRAGKGLGLERLHGLRRARPCWNLAPRCCVFSDRHRGSGPRACNYRLRQVAGDPGRDRLATSSRSSLQAEGIRSRIDGDHRNLAGSQTLFKQGIAADLGSRRLRVANANQNQRQQLSRQARSLAAIWAPKGPTHRNILLAWGLFRDQRPRSVSCAPGPPLPGFMISTPAATTGHHRR